MSYEILDEEDSKKILDSVYRAKMYERFVAHVTDGTQRRGQAWMNALGDVDLGLYQIINSTPYDCFYDDRKIDAFKERVFGKGGD